MSKILKKVKKYWNKQPCNINHSKKKFLSKTQDEPIKTLSFFLFSLVEILK